LSNVVIPYSISFNKWANQQSFLRPDLNWPVPPTEEDQWDGWSSFVYFSSSNLYPFIPYPSRVVYPKNEDWRAWAAQTIFQLVSL
jgi:hypothetical protein